MLEVIRAVTDWLSGDTLDYQGNPQGIAVHLAALNYDGTDTAPATPVVLDETRDGVTARKEIPDGTRLLMVTQFVGEWEPSYMNVEQRGRVTLLLRVAIKGEVNSDDAVRDSYYYCRAMKRSLVRLHMAENGNVGRSRGDIDFYHDPDQPIQMGRAEPMREDDVTTYALKPSYLVREKDP